MLPPNDGGCRSPNCDKKAEFYAHMPAFSAGPGKREPEWNGKFCAGHLARCIDVKITEIPRPELMVSITIWRI